MRHLPSTKTYLATIVVLILLGVSHYFGWLKPIENKLSQSLLPWFSRTHNISIRVADNYQFFKNRQSFFDAYQLCSSAAEQQQVLTATVAVLKQENEELKKQLNFAQTSHKQLVITSVVGNDLNDVAKTIVLDRGSADGLKLNQPVIAGNGILVGKLIKVSDHLSLARLIPDNHSKIIAALLNQERSTGIVEGGYGLSLRLKFIPRNEIVTVGQQVITSGLETGIPRGLLIGVVAVVENEAYQPFQQALITPAVDYSKLTVVSVIIN